MTSCKSSFFTYTHSSVQPQPFAKSSVLRAAVKKKHFFPDMLDPIITKSKSIWEIHSNFLHTAWGAILSLLQIPLSVKEHWTLSSILEDRCDSMKLHGGSGSHESSFTKGNAQSDDNPLVFFKKSFCLKNCPIQKKNQHH